MAYRRRAGGQKRRPNAWARRTRLWLMKRSRVQGPLHAIFLLSSYFSIWLGDSVPSSKCPWRKQYIFQPYSRDSPLSNAAAVGPVSFIGIGRCVWMISNVDYYLEKRNKKKRKLSCWEFHKIYKEKVVAGCLPNNPIHQIHFVIYSDDYIWFRFWFQSSCGQSTDADGFFICSSSFSSLDIVKKEGNLRSAAQRRRWAQKCRNDALHHRPWCPHIIISKKTARWMQQPSKKTLKHPGNTLTVRIVWVPYNWSLVGPCHPQTE